MTDDPKTHTAIILAGGMGLGAYHAGVLESLWQGGVQLDWLAGSSIGAVTAAIAAGAFEPRQALRDFWGLPSQPEFPSAGHLLRWASVVEARLAGVPGHFRPRLRLPIQPFVSLYDLSPMRDRLHRLVDFGRLNSGAVRISIAATDIESGELVVFDTGKGDRIGMEHLLASCGYLPDFAPVQVAGRWLGDGGLCANVPLEAVLTGDAPDPLTCFVVDLFARDSPVTHNLESAMARRGDLQFANQTWQRLQAHLRHMAARTEQGHPGRQHLVYLSYRSTDAEAGPEKMFDYSLGSVSQRWRAGAADGRQACAQLAAPPQAGAALTVVRRAL